MILAFYYGAVALGVVGVLAQHYLPRLKAISQFKFKLPSLSVKKFGLPEPRSIPPMPMISPNRTVMDGIRAKMGLPPFGSEPSNSFDDIHKELNTPKYDEAWRRQNQRGGSGGVTFAYTGGGGGTAEGEARANSIKRGGAGGAGAFVRYNDAVNHTPVGLEILDRINKKYPFAQAIFHQTMSENTFSPAISMVWFTSRGNKRITNLTVQYPDFQHMDIHDANVDGMFFQACITISDAEHQETEEEKQKKIVLAKPTPQQAYPEYMNTIMAKKLEEIAARPKNPYSS